MREQEQKQKTVTVLHAELGWNINHAIAIIWHQVSLSDIFIALFAFQKSRKSESIGFDCNQIYHKYDSESH